VSSAQRLRNSFLFVFFSVLVNKINFHSGKKIIQFYGENADKQRFAVVDVVVGAVVVFHNNINNNDYDYLLLLNYF
jgi:hypothetical protein